MHDNTLAVGVFSFSAPGSTRLHPVSLLQEAGDEDKSPLTGGLLYCPVAREVKGGHDMWKPVWEDAV